MNEFSGLCVGLFAVTVFPISIAVTDAINRASVEALSCVMSDALEDTKIGYGVALGLSVLIIAANLLQVGCAALQNHRSLPFYGSVMAIFVAIGGIAICSFLLDTISQLNSPDDTVNVFTLIMKHDPAQLQILLGSEPALIAGVVISIVAVFALAALSVYCLVNR